ncbi:adenylosuccinate synthetase [Hymenobacter negativus]|uniref:Adenylosuccinate synthetase n=1 Tax=Hymenobacter negativus TaxID=2795026 RepID=A0ABS3QHE0_9BACT|nr:adenylosuccinate synthetase [Hymenobacter negativus]MBO2010403.1 adenylosuccinate synthetase [Hymenobacter negativus]
MITKEAHIVVGLGFGDEGKGLATDWLCGRALAQGRQPLVVRFNGGHQAGHTVTTAAGQRHVFSNFGAGTLRGVPTYWSEYCTFSPGSVLKEYAALQAAGVQPRLLVDARCPVTTHYDVLYNRALETTRGAARHGSCGLGFGATIERHEQTPLRLYAQDLRFPTVYGHKLRQIRAHYRTRIQTETTVDFDQFDHDAEDQRFGAYAEALVRLHGEQVIQLVNEADVFGPASTWQAFIFEGAQGVLLDMDFGLFPHVTRSHTTTTNALALLQRNQPDLAAKAEVHYITRAYHTRHGAGPFPHEAEVSLINNRDETNQLNDYQGHFRTGPLSVELLNYALACDATISTGLRKHLLVTCLDQLPDGLLPCWHDNQLRAIVPTALSELLETEFASCQFSTSSSGAGLPEL